jgi:diaminopimelate epimerase
LFFETSINAEAYQERMQQFIALLQVNERNCLFQQGCATALTAASTIVILH